MCDFIFYLIGESEVCNLNIETDPHDYGSKYIEIYIVIIGQEET